MVSSRPHIQPFLLTWDPEGRFYFICFPLSRSCTIVNFNWFLRPIPTHTNTRLIIKKLKLDWNLPWYSGPWYFTLDTKWLMWSTSTTIITVEPYILYSFQCGKHLTDRWPYSPSMRSRATGQGENGADQQVAWLQKWSWTTKQHYDSRYYFLP